MADITIDAATHTSGWTAKGQRSVVFTSASVGYFFFIDGDSDVKYAKTTDGGATWGSPVTIYIGTALAYDIWYDRWTPGDSGTLIHIFWLESTTDNAHHRTLDTSSDSLGTDRVISTGTVAAASLTTMITGAKMRGGNLEACGHTSTEFFHVRSTDGGVNWASRAAIVEGGGSDFYWMFPGNEADANDAWVLYHDDSANELTLKTVDDSADTVSESSAILSVVKSSGDIAAQWPLGATIRHSDGHLIVAVSSSFDVPTADHRVFDINGAGSITEKSAIATDIDDLYYLQPFIDQSTNHLYIAYIGKRDGSESVPLTGSPTAGVYYTKSTDGGATWSAGDTAYSFATGAYRQTWAPLMGPRFMVAYREVIGQALYTNFDNSIALAAGGVSALLKMLVHHEG